MKLDLSIASLRSLLALSEKRDDLFEEIQKVEIEMSRIIGSDTKTSPSKKSPPSLKPKGKAAKRAKRGTVKELILAALKESGQTGIAVKHLAAKHDLKPGSVHVWLGTTGRKSGLIEALGKGVYRLKQSLGVEPSQNSLKAPKPKTTRKAPKAKNRKRRN